MYEGFARVYDEFMRDAPYECWVKNVRKLWQRYEKNPRLVLDLGCGTGSATILFAKAGLEMIGVDLSAEMLNIAADKSRAAEADILYLQQDMRSFELYGTVDAVVSLCDSMNYILSANELLEVFKLVHNYLEPEGIFVFDMNTQYKFQCVLADNSFSEVTEDAAYIWENYYDEETMINEYCTYFFVKREDGLYSRQEEIHHQAAYSVETVLNLLRKAGLTPKSLVDADTMKGISADTQRIYFTATKEKEASHEQ